MTERVQASRPLDLVVMRTAAIPPQQIVGTVHAVRTNALVARLPAGPAFQPSEPLLLISGAVGSRMVAKARFAGAQGDVVAFQLTTEFQPFDVRRANRVPVQLTAEVRSVLGSSRQQGAILDVSTGGLAVAVATRPGGRAIEILVTANGYAASLPCQTVSTSEHEECVILHLRFDKLAPAQDAFVRQLVAHAAREAGEDERLAS